MRNQSVWQSKGIAAVLDTNVLVAARIARPDLANPAREIYRLAGILFDSYTSPAVLAEVQRVLARPRFGVAAAETVSWLDVFVRGNRQVDTNRVPWDFDEQVGDALKNNPLIQTAFAVNLDPDSQLTLSAARAAAGSYLVSLDPQLGSNQSAWGWTFIRPDDFLRLLTETV